MPPETKPNGSAENMDDQRSVADELAAAFDGSEGEAEAEEQSAKSDLEEAAGEDHAETTEDAEAAGPEADETAEGEEPAEEAETEEAPETQLTAPDHWSAEDREFFSGLPDDDTRQRVLDWRKSIERGAQDKFDDAAEARKEQRELAELWKPFEQELAQAGMTRMDGVRRLVAAENLLRTEPERGFDYLAQQYGARFAGTAQARETVRRIASALKVDLGGQAGQAEASDPTATKIDALKTEIAELKRSNQQSSEQARAQEAQRTEAVIREFAEAKLEDGQPKHPHFEAVKSDMGMLMQAASSRGEALDLDQAYERAVWSRPDLRDKLLESRQKADATKAAQQRKATVEKAKAAKTPRSASAPAQPAEDDDVPVRDMLARELDRAVGGART